MRSLLAAGFFLLLTPNQTGGSGIERERGTSEGGGGGQRHINEPDVPPLHPTDSRKTGWVFFRYADVTEVHS